MIQLSDCFPCDVIENTHLEKIDEKSYTLVHVVVKAYI